MSPIKVKAWGLFSISKRSYLAFQAISIGLLTATYAFLAYYPFEQLNIEKIDRLENELPPTVLDNWPWLIVGCLCLLGLEMIYMARKFREQEKIQQQNQSQPDDSSPIDESHNV